MKIQHSQRIRTAHCVSIAVILAASSGLAVAQEFGQADLFGSAPRPVWSQQEAAEPAAAQTALAGYTATETDSQEGKNRASFLASSTDDPNWIDEPARLASFNAPSGNSPLGVKGVRVGSLTVVPYGRLWADMLYSTSRATPGDFILWIDSEETQGEDTFVIDARRSRIGIDVQGWEAKNENLRLLVGQTWDVTSPLLPNTVNFPVGWAVGNIGFRRTQFRVERHLHLTDDVKLSLQSALAQNIVPDFLDITGVTRETGDWPMVEGRMALTFPVLWQQKWTIGWSGHVGETGFDFDTVSPGPRQLPPQDDARFDSWSVNADFNLPITDRLGFHGEVFTGSDLSNLLGGIVQGVGLTTRSPIRSTGGWGEIWYDWTSCITTHVGAGIDDPDNDDFMVGRTYNRVIYSNVWVQLTNNLRTGFEVSSWRTSYQNRTRGTNYPVAGPTRPGKATSLDWTVMYTF